MATPILVLRSLAEGGDALAFVDWVVVVAVVEGGRVKIVLFLLSVEGGESAVAVLVVGHCCSCTYCEERKGEENVFFFWISVLQT